MTLDPSELTVLPPCPEPVSVLREHEDYILVEKPAGLLTVPGRNPANHDCVVARLQLEFPGASVVHRLDFDTSGVMVFARHKRAHAAIARQFQERQVRKAYTAIVAGCPEPAEGEINAALSKDREHPPRSKVDEQGKWAQTRYRVLDFDREADTSRLALYPVTGRSHQLRLHLAHIGHPILGCQFYAPQELASRSDRLLLHATRLAFTAPDGRPVEIGSDCPF